MNFQIPPTLKAEHEELHGELTRATKAGGRTGECQQLNRFALAERLPFQF